jgi:hypothetical protein
MKKHKHIPDLLSVEPGHKPTTPICCSKCGLILYDDEEFIIGRFRVTRTLRIWNESNNHKRSPKGTG